MEDFESGQRFAFILSDAFPGTQLQPLRICLRIRVHICNAAQKCCYGRGSLDLKWAEARWEWTLWKGHRGEERKEGPFLRGHKGNKKKMSSNTWSDKSISPTPDPGDSAEGREATIISQRLLLQGPMFPQVRVQPGFAQKDLLLGNDCPKLLCDWLLHLRPASECPPHDYLEYKWAHEARNEFSNRRTWMGHNAVFNSRRRKKKKAPAACARENCICVDEDTQ